MKILLEPQRPAIPAASHPKPSVPTRLRTFWLLEKVWPYAAIAKPDYWFKNVFMLLGVLLGLFYHPATLDTALLTRVLWALASTCLVASSNYVLNESLDASTDRNHPTKRYRPIPSGHVLAWVGYTEWLLLGFLGLLMAYALNYLFFFSALFLLIMGLAY